MRSWGGSSNTPPQPHAYNLKDALTPVPSHWKNLLSQTQKSKKLYEKISKADQIKRDLILDIGIDYLMGMIRLADMNPFLSYVQSVFKADFEYLDTPITHGSQRFTGIFLEPLSKLKLYHRYDDDLGLNVIAFIAPGKAVRQLGKREIIEFIIRANCVFGLRFTCIDIRLDDYKKRSNFRSLHRIAKKGDVAGAQLYKYIAGGVSGDEGIQEADTIYFGSKRTQLKIYNADFLHNIPAYRWEGRFRDKKAVGIVNYLKENYDDFSIESDLTNLWEMHTYLANKVLNICKFIKRNKDKKQSLSRFKRYRFYDSLLKDVGELDPEVLRDPPIEKPNEYQFIKRSFDWLNRQVFKRLSMLQDVLGNDIFSMIYQACITSANDRYSKLDDAIHNKLKNYIGNLEPVSLSQFSNSLFPKASM